MLNSSPKSLWRLGNHEWARLGAAPEYIRSRHTDQFMEAQGKLRICVETLTDIRGPDPGRKFQTGPDGPTDLLPMNLLLIDKGSGPRE